MPGRAVAIADESLAIDETLAAALFEGLGSLQVRCDRVHSSGRLCWKPLLEAHILDPLLCDPPAPGDPIVRLTYSGDPRGSCHHNRHTRAVEIRETEGDPWGATRLHVRCKCGAEWVLKAAGAAMAIAARYQVGDFDDARCGWLDLATSEVVGR